MIATVDGLSCRLRGVDAAMLKAAWNLALPWTLPDGCVQDTSARTWATWCFTSVLPLRERVSTVR